MTLETDNTLRCRHRDYSDFLTRCETCYSLCFSCLVTHLKSHGSVVHVIYKDLMDAASIVVSVRQGMQSWKLNFASVEVATAFFSHYEGLIDAIRIKTAGIEPVSLCTALIKFDHIRQISATGFKLQAEEACRAFAAWLRSQSRLHRVSLYDVGFTGRAFGYLSPGLCSENLLELTLSKVNLPDGNTGELVRRVLEKGVIQKLSLREMILNAWDTEVLGRLRDQKSLVTLKLVQCSFLGVDHLSEWLPKLQLLKCLRVIDSSGKTLHSIGTLLSSLSRLRDLSLFTHRPQRLSFLPLILPSLPHLRVLTLLNYQLEVLLTTEFLDTVMAILDRASSNGGV